MMALLLHFSFNLCETVVFFNVSYWKKSYEILPKKTVYISKVLFPLTNRRFFFYCFKAGSLSRDQSPSNADTLDPCQPFPFPDHLFFDETSAAGRLHRYCLCCTPIYMYIIVQKTAFLTILVNIFQLKVTLFLYQLRSIPLSTDLCEPDLSDHIAYCCGFGLTYVRRNQTLLIVNQFLFLLPSSIYFIYVFEVQLQVQCIAKSQLRSWVRSI